MAQFVILVRSVDVQVGSAVVGDGGGDAAISRGTDLIRVGVAASAQFQIISGSRAGLGVAPRSVVGQRGPLARVGLVIGVGVQRVRAVGAIVVVVTPLIRKTERTLGIGVVEIAKDNDGVLVEVSHCHAARDCS